MMDAILSKLKKLYQERKQYKDRVSHQTNDRPHHSPCPPKLKEEILSLEAEYVQTVVLPQMNDLFDQLTSDLETQIEFYIGEERFAKLKNSDTYQMLGVDSIINKISTTPAAQPYSNICCFDVFGIERVLLNNANISQKSFPGAVRLKGYNRVLRKKNFVGYIAPSVITKNHDLIGLYKVVVMNNMLYSYSFPAKRQNPKIAIYRPNEIPANSRDLIIGTFHSLAHAENCVKYFSSDFVAFLLLSKQRPNSIFRNIYPKQIKELPYFDFSLPPNPIDWTQSIESISMQIYKYFGLTQNEISIIHSYLPLYNIENKKTIASKVARNDENIIELPNGKSIPATYLPYIPNNVDSILIDSLWKILGSSFQLPTIEVTDATPPIMKHPPTSFWAILKPLPGESQNIRDKIKSELPEDYIVEALWYKPIHIEKYDIERVLGIYDPKERKIVLYERGILAVSKEEKIDLDILRSVVLVHELGHWLSHTMPQGTTQCWENVQYNHASTDVHEGWAQLFDYWAVDQNSNKAYYDAFAALNKNQSLPYHTYEKFIKHPYQIMLDSLEPLRKIDTATLTEWIRITEKRDI